MIKVLDHGFVTLMDSMPAKPIPYLVGLQNGDVKLKADPRWGALWGPGDQRVVDAARTSIAGREVRPVSDDAKLLKHLLTSKPMHSTPFEAVRFTFHCKMPIFIARQWVRHRTASISEQSARYGVMAEEFYVPDPERMQRQSTNNKQGSGEQLEPHVAAALRDTIRRTSEECYRTYDLLLRQGLARELARMVLPTNWYTQWYWTTDLHNFMHFLRLRLDHHAQSEIRDYGQALLDEARPIAPHTFSLFEASL